MPVIRQAAVLALIVGLLSAGIIGVGSLYGRWASPPGVVRVTPSPTPTPGPSGGF